MAAQVHIGRDPDAPEDEGPTGLEAVRVVPYADAQAISE
jgi:hypothetical protein